ncbi:hypothetical protein DW998_16880 [Parabacteroides distasonis]|nr:hypothetical protein DW998_16880 [Parabacteroides distasonis]
MFLPKEIYFSFGRNFVFVRMKVYFLLNRIFNFSRIDLLREKSYICNPKLRKECNLLEMSIG